MWLLLPFLPLMLLEAIISDIFSPVKELFEKLTQDIDFDRVFKD